jgi:threonine dehydrogenase-like Zn-dependent dehydrogenase
MSYGGYADYHRAPSHFVFKIPESIPSEDAAPMLCGGITLYSPLKNEGCGPGKKVGIIGVGGLGHFGVLFAKALGADKVVGISRKADKKDDVLKLGADEYISTDEDPDWVKHHARSLDLIVCTVSNSKMPLVNFTSNHMLIQLLTVHVDGLLSTPPYQRYLYPGRCTRGQAPRLDGFRFHRQGNQTWWFDDWPAVADRGDVELRRGEEYQADD